MKRKTILAALFLLPVFILVPHLNDFFIQPGVQYTDIAVSHYPNGVFLQNTLLEWKVVPLWSPAILSGFPFVANPLSGLHYPPGWLAYLFPLPLGFNLLVVLHLLWGGAGAFLLLKQEGLRDSSAVFGGLVFEAFPKLFSHLGAGHLTLMYAVCWTPWLLYVEKKSRSTRYRWIAPGMIIGVIALADIRWAAYSGFLWAANSLQCDWRSIDIKGRKGLTRLLAWVPSAFTNVCMAIFTAAPLLLPLLQFVSLSSRSRLSPSENVILSLPPAQLFGLVIPNIGGSAEWVLYPGGLVLFLVIYAIGLADVRKRAGFWLGVIFFTLFISLGSNIPYLDSVFSLPVLNLLRVPPRVIFITGLAFGVVSAQSMDTLLGPRESAIVKGEKWVGMVIFGITAFVTLMAIVVALTVQNDLVKIQFAWAAVVLLAGFLILRLFWSKKIDSNWFYLLLVSTVMVDMVAINCLSLTFLTKQQVLSSGQAAVDFILKDAGEERFRTYSPSYSLPQQTAAGYGLELADGVDPLQMLSYVLYMEKASGVSFDGYSVTLPSFATGNPAEDNRTSIPDPDLLGLLNVKYVLSEFPLKVQPFNLLASFGNTRVYQNLRVFPRAWIQPAGQAGSEVIQPVQLVEYQPNLIRLTARGPGLLVLSELYYPGWKVSIDNIPANLVIVMDLFRGVYLPEGEHSVIFTYFPGLFYLGLVLCGMACLGLGLMVFFRRGNDGRSS